MKKSQYIGLFLLLVIGLWLFCFVTLKMWLVQYAIGYAETGEMTIGYFLYTVIGLLFSTPAPFVAMLVIALWKEKIGLKEFFRRIFHTEQKGKTIFITAVFCLFALVFALVNGKPNGSPWYMLPLGFLIMIPFVGIAEETGWRGFLQPALEEKIRFPGSVLCTAAIWFVWHLDLWLDPTSNHYNDSLIGFGITILIWSFALAAIYKATGSVIACAVYHAFIDAIGAVYDWNSLFDPFPGNIYTNVYRVFWLALSVGVWLWADKLNTRRINEQKAEKDGKDGKQGDLC